MGVSRIASLSALSDEGIGDWYAYEPVKNYECLEARLRLTLGKKHFRFNISPLGYTWVVLPSFRKYDLKKNEIDYTDFGSIRFFSPSIGISYAFYRKMDAADKYRALEIPLSLNFSPMWSGKTDMVKVNNVAYDSEFKDYFKDFKFNLTLSAGINIFVSEGFGLGFSVGYYYFNIKRN